MATDSPILPQDLVDALVTCTETLNERGIAYAVIGGMAAGFRSQPRFTKDVDFLLRIPQLQLPGLLESLEAKGLEFEMLTTIREWTQNSMTRLSFHGIRVDWLAPMLPAYAHILERAREEDWLDHRIRVASVEGLILTKLLALRTQDQLDIENLLAYHEDKLDLDWLRTEWQTIAPLEDPRFKWFMAKLSSRK
jgi:hypothetical protein